MAKLTLNCDTEDGSMEVFVNGKQVEGANFVGCGMDKPYYVDDKHRAYFEIGTDRVKDESGATYTTRITAALSDQTQPYFDRVQGSYKDGVYTIRIDDLVDRASKIFSNGFNYC